MVYPHRIYYAWQRLPLLQIEHRNILWFKLHNVVSQLKRKIHAVINHSNIQEQIIRVSGMGANPSRTQTINFVIGIVNLAMLMLRRPR
jgi:protein subunit release factor B